MFNLGIGYYQTLGSLQAAGPNLTASTTPTSLLNPQAKIALPANFFAYVGQKLYIRAQGQISNIITTPGTLTLDIRFGSTVVFNGAAMQLGATQHTTLPFWLEIDLTVRTVGSSANLMGQGRITSQCFVVTAGTADSANTHTTLVMPNATPAVGTNFDATATQVVDMFGTFNLNNANAITVQQYELITCNWGG